MTVFPIIAVEVALNPSGSPPSPPFPDVSGYLIRLIPLTLACIATMVSALYRPKVWRLLLSLAMGWGATWVAAVTVHRDFYSAFLPLGLAGWCMYLQLYHEIVPEHRRAHRRLLITVLSVTIWIAVLVWIILMSYSIVVRSEPRWAESTIYNIYNTGWLIFLYWSWNKYRIVSDIMRLLVTPSHVELNDIDITSIFGISRIRVFHTLLLYWKRGYPLTCIEFNYNAGKTRSCLACKDGEGKASLCPNYKHLYNGILTLRKFLEAFHLGSIISPENKRHIIRTGWIFMPTKELQITILNK
jgi:hypothetical protein